MSTPIRLLELRLSFSYTETYSDLLTGADNKDSMAFLRNQKGYAQRFETIKLRMEALSKQRTGAAADGGIAASLGAPEQVTPDPYADLTAPWPWSNRKYMHYFWQYYLENREPNTISGEHAWKFLVPFRTQFNLRITSPWDEEGPKWGVMVDGLFYPHGVAVVIMPRLVFKRQMEVGETNGLNDSGLGLQRSIERALEVRRERTLPFSFHGGVPEQLKLDSIAVALLSFLRERALGKGASQGARASEPLSVATVIQGRGGSATTPILAKSDLHRFLEGLCSWDSNWALMQGLSPLEQANLLLAGDPAGDMVYHTSRGRAVWMPRLFNPSRKRRYHQLSCYHRNLSLVTLQTEMLARLVALYSDWLDQGQTPTEEFTKLTKFAAIRLGFLYATLKRGGLKYTYHSASPRAYLHENGYVDIINRVRGSMKLAPLSYTPY